MAKTIPMHCGLDGAGESKSLEEQGLILIPDISGYTAFVHAAHPAHSQRIVASLLECLIEEDRLGLDLCEIEGDALLLFRPGRPPSLPNLIGQAQAWFHAFQTTRDRLLGCSDCTCAACNSLSGLTVKVIGHAGRVRTQRIGGLTRLFGEDVILVHRLLKNSLDLHSYFMITDALAGPGADSALQSVASFGHTELDAVLGTIKVHVLPLPISPLSRTTC